MFWDYILLIAVSLLAFIGLFPKKENSKWGKWVWGILTVFIIVSNFILLDVRKQEESENQEKQDSIFINTRKSAQSSQEVINYMNQFDSLKYKKFKPEIEVELKEISDGVLEIMVFAPNTNKSKIDRMYIKFDIPGEFVKFENEDDNFERINKEYIIDTTSTYWAGKKVLKQTFKIEFKEIFPNGFFRGKLFYNLHNTKTQYLDDGTKIIFTMSNMLHKYLSYDYTWLFDGTNINEKGFIDLRDLNILKRDMKNQLEGKTLIKKPLKDFLNDKPENQISVLIIENKLNEALNDSTYILPIEGFYSKEYYQIHNDTLIRVIERKPDPFSIRMFNDPKVSHNMKFW